MAGEASEAAKAGDAVAAAHRQLVADGRTQFDLPMYQPPKPPDWLQPLIEWLARSGPVVKVVYWIGVAVVAALALYALWKWLAPLVRRWLNRVPAAAEPEGWTPEAAPARALLAEADALAARGAFAEAAHLLLLRSVEQIEARADGRVRPSYTSRDIAGAPMLPPHIARAFRHIAGVVEGGLFAARPVSAGAWQGCRAAYEEAAFGKRWA